MRFQPQELLFVVHFGFDEDVKHYPWFRLPLQYDNNVPTEINFALLEVTEHHKVPNEWDTKGVLDCDGYILKDDKGVVYHNQYPRASYGQTTDTGNRRFTRHVETKEEIDKLTAEEPKVVFEYHLLSDVIETIERGIRDLKEVPVAAEHHQRAQEKLQKLVEFQDRLIKEFDEKYPEYKLTVEWKPAFEGSKLVWPDASYHMVTTTDKIKEKSKEEITKILKSFGRIEAEWPHCKDRIGINFEEGSYYINRETTKVKSIEVMYLEHGAQMDDDDKPGFFVCNSDIFPRDWVEAAVDCFIARVNDSDHGFKARNTGMNMEAIAARDKAPEGIVQVKSEGQLNAEAMREAVDKLHEEKGTTLGDLVRQKLH